MLKKGDAVVMHTCGEAEHYDGQIWICKTDEYTAGKDSYKQSLIYLEGFSGCFATEFLQKVKIPAIKKITVYDNGCAEVYKTDGTDSVVTSIEYSGAYLSHEY